jgi:hypothetical protein
MLRFLFRLLFTILLFVIGNLLTAGRSRPREGRRDAGAGGRGGAGRDAGAGGGGARRSGPHPPLDRSDVLDVPFTEVPPPGEPRPAREPGAGGAAAEPGAGAAAADPGRGA